MGKKKKKKKKPKLFQHIRMVLSGALQKRKERFLGASRCQCSREHQRSPLAGISRIRLTSGFWYPGCFADKMGSALEMLAIVAELQHKGNNTNALRTLVKCAFMKLGRHRIDWASRAVYQCFYARYCVSCCQCGMLELHLLQWKECKERGG